MRIRKGTPACVISISEKLMTPSPANRLATQRKPRNHVGQGTPRIRNHIRRSVTPFLTEKIERLKRDKPDGFLAPEIRLGVGKFL
jgi:hypothetical protein